MSHPGDPMTLLTKVQRKDQHKDDYHLPLPIPDRGLTSETKQDSHPLNQNHATQHWFLLNFQTKSYTDSSSTSNLTPVPPEVLHGPISR